MKRILNAYPDVPVLAEEYLDGPQYLVEILVYRGKLNIVAIFKQEVTYNKRFIITGYSLIIDPPEGFFNSLKRAVITTVKNHGMECGSCHLELRLVKDEWKLIEINPRISGAGMNKLIEIGLGINLVEESLKMALGFKPHLKPRFRRHAFAQYITVSESGILEKAGQADTQVLE